jgi:hypothetical protein
MQLNFSEKEDKIKRQKEVNFITPAKAENNPHRTPIQKILLSNGGGGDGNFLVMSMDGIFSFWNSLGDLKRMRKEIVSFIEICRNWF